MLIQDLSYRYSHTLPWVLQDLRLQLPRQGILGLLGHNGAGKSTLMSIAAGLYPIERGEIRDDQGKPLDSHTLIEQVSLVPQDYAFYQELSVLQNLQLFFRIAEKHQQVVALNQVIEFCQLSALLKQPVAQLSGGQKRKLNLAIGLIKDTNILLLDEPTVGIDPQSKRELLNVIKSLAEAGKSIVYTSHILHEVEQICDYFCILHHGVLALAPTPFGQHENNQKSVVQLQSVADKNKFGQLVNSLTIQWPKNDTAIIDGLSLSSYASLLQNIEQAEIRIQSSSFGQDSLEQLYFSLTQEAS